ncbi:MAG: hypothetical protein WDZ77_00290 [Candidatus Pacearchaeota archaeon]
MKKEKNQNENLRLLFGILTFIFIFAFSVNFISSQSTVSYCAERTLDGAWCQNVPQSQVDENYRSAPTSCQSTAFCKLGTCVNSQEGTCFDNTPQIICEQPEGEITGGVWFDAEKESLPQCSLGCCLLGNEASFVTQARCNQLSSDYGLDINYRPDINSEVACIATAVSDKKGACVFERNFERTCQATTGAKCQELALTEENVEFHQGLLCSAEELATNCGPSENTILVDGRDEVFFRDTCGNVANIYDSSRQDDANYWRDIFEKSESCGFLDSRGNAGSKSCGNCDYFLGSTGKTYDRSVDPQSPDFGDYICRDLGCEYQGEDFQHGETWCSSNSKNGESLPGERLSRLVCYNGEVTTESCSGFRQEICVEGEINGFSAAACRVNKWQDCMVQGTQKTCEDSTLRACQWIEGQRFDRDTTQEEEQGSCVPKYPPGFDFWNPNTDAASLCSLANNDCVVRWEKSGTDILTGGGYDCVENCHCLEDSWGELQNNICLALGDCGATLNYIGGKGANELDDLVVIGPRD